MLSTEIFRAKNIALLPLDHWQAFELILDFASLMVEFLVVYITLITQFTIKESQL